MATSVENRWLSTTDSKHYAQLLDILHAIRERCWSADIFDVPPALIQYIKVVFFNELNGCDLLFLFLYAWHFLIRSLIGTESFSVTSLKFCPLLSTRIYVSVKFVAMS